MGSIIITCIFVSKSILHENVNTFIVRLIKTSGCRGFYWHTCGTCSQSDTSNIYDYSNQWNLNTAIGYLIKNEPRILYLYSTIKKHIKGAFSDMIKKGLRESACNYRLDRYTRAIRMKNYTNRTCNHTYFIVAWFNL